MKRIFFQKLDGGKEKLDQLESDGLINFFSSCIIVANSRRITGLCFIHFYLIIGSLVNLLATGINY